MHRDDKDESRRGMSLLQGDIGAGGFLLHRDRDVPPTGESRDAGCLSYKETSGPGGFSYIGTGMSLLPGRVETRDVPPTGES